MTSRPTPSPPKADSPSNLSASLVYPCSVPIGDRLCFVREFIGFARGFCGVVTNDCAAVAVTEKRQPSALLITQLLSSWIHTRLNARETMMKRTMGIGTPAPSRSSAHRSGALSPHTHQQQKKGASSRKPLLAPIYKYELRQFKTVRTSARSVVARALADFVLAALRIAGRQSLRIEVEQASYGCGHLLPLFLLRQFFQFVSQRTGDLLR